MAKSKIVRPFIVRIGLRAVLYFCICGYCEYPYGETFPVPEIIIDNVAFWKKIYTKVSLDEGLLHDCDYPSIVYKKITFNGVPQQRRDKIVEREKNRIKAVLVAVASKPESQWKREERRVAALLKNGIPKSAVSGAHNRLRFQQGQRERFLQGLHRSGAYMDSIRAIFTRYKIPHRVAYLPHVESSFNPAAYSKAGAAGLWQIMRATATPYLKIDYIVDERRDPILSTHAAAKILSHNYTELKSWPLAITAYNHGLYGVKQAVKTTGSRDIAAIIRRYDGRSFGFASRNFYSCFLAASEIAQSPKKYFVRISFAPPVDHKNIVLDFPVKPQALASLFSVSKDHIRRLNPAIRQVAFTQNRPIPKGTVIRLPPSIPASVLKTAFNTIPDSVKGTGLEAPVYYTVRRGDNLHSIARKFRIPSMALAKENAITRINKIYAGQILVIPHGITVVSKTRPAPVLADASDKQGVRKVHTGVVDTALFDDAPPALPPDTESSVPYAPSDSIRDLVLTAADTLTGDSGMGNTRKIHAFDATVYNLGTVYDPVKKQTAVFVSSNETMGHFAEWLGISVQKILSLNRIKRHSGIHIGKKIFLPGNKAAIERFSQKRLEYHMAIEEDFFARYTVTEVRPRIMRAGETIWNICRNDNVIPLWLLKKYNKHLNVVDVPEKTNLLIPVLAEMPDSVEQN